MPARMPCKDKQPVGLQAFLKKSELSAIPFHRENLNPLMRTETLFIKACMSIPGLRCRKD